MKPVNQLVKLAALHLIRQPVLRIILAALLVAVVVIPSRAGGKPNAANADHHPVSHKTIKVDGLDIFYREAGPANAPVILLLHGFPTSSHMFRNLIPALSDRYHVIAPDYPGFGQSSMLA